MKEFIKVIIISILCGTSSFAGPAISGVRLFTQPDGTQFEGELKGDSSFHWIESDGDVVIYNSKDKFYYKAIVDKKLTLTNTKPKPKPKIDKTSAFVPQVQKQHAVSPDDRKNLCKLYKKSKIGNYPK